MKDDVALLATVTLLGVLLQAYFSLQVISARRAFHVSPPLTSGPPEFERVFRAQCRSPVRTLLPVRAPPLLPGICTLGAAEVTSRTGEGCYRWEAVIGRRGPLERDWDPRWADLAQRSWSSPVEEGPEPAGRGLGSFPLSSAGRLAPLYASARALWLLVAMAALGLLAHFLPDTLRAALFRRFQALLQMA